MIWERGNRLVTKFWVLHHGGNISLIYEILNYILTMKQEIYQQILSMMHTYGSRDCLKTIALQFPGYEGRLVIN